MYVKLFSSIYQGTLRGRPHGLLVFTNLLAHCDASGFCDIHPNAIADEVGLTAAEVRAALLELEAPDAESRTPDNDGRRILRVDEHRAWGWQVTNYAKYRAIRNEEDKREQNRLAQERWRNKNKPPVMEISRDKPPSDTISRDKPMQKEKEKEKEKEKQGIPAPPIGVAPEVWQDWLKIRKAKRLPWTETAWQEIQAEIVKAGISEDAAIRECCARGWGSFRADWHAKHNGHNGSGETAYQRSMREKWEAATGRNKLEIIDGDARLLG